MNGPLAQIIALTCHGRSALNGEAAEPFFPGNSTCTFCAQIDFVTLEPDGSGGPLARPVANSPDEWFAVLRERGAQTIRLSHTPGNDPGISDRMSAGFVGGGGSWCMEVLLDDGRSEFWLARWKVENRDAPDNRIWGVSYGCVASGASTTLPQQELEDILARLRHSLTQIHAFSSRHDYCSGFTACFERALESLDEGIRKGFHQDLAPEGQLPDASMRIFEACQHAWVFGGMGSWNDIWFEDAEQAEYDRVSEQLFTMINQAIPAAVNAAA